MLLNPLPTHVHVKMYLDFSLKIFFLHIFRSRKNNSSHHWILKSKINSQLQLRDSNSKLITCLKIFSLYDFLYTSIL